MEVETPSSTQAPRRQPAEHPPSAMVLTSKPTPTQTCCHEELDATACTRSTQNVSLQSVRSHRLKRHGKWSMGRGRLTRPLGLDVESPLVLPRLLGFLLAPEEVRGADGGERDDDGVAAAVLSIVPIVRHSLLHS